MPLVAPRRDVLERVHALWDRLADFDAPRTDRALRHLLAESAGIASAQNAYWLGVVRVPAGVRDGMLGWRPRAIQYLHRSRADSRLARRGIRRIGHGGVGGPETLAHVRETGRFRARRLRDLRLPRRELQEAREIYRGRGIHDVLWVVAPITADAECYYGFHRKTAGSPFTPAQRDAVAYAMRGIKWFHRQVMLSHGALVARSPLSPAERWVTALLLTSRSEKEIAGVLGLTAATAHKYVTDVFRKFGVSGRSGLAALWLGSAFVGAGPPPDQKG